MEVKRQNPNNILVKEYIVSALLKLIESKTVSSISITELCKKAGVSRMSFYRNYDSIEDIFSKQLAEIFENYKNDELTQNVKGFYYDKEHMNHYFNYLYTYREFLDGIIQCGYDVMFLNMLNEYIIDKWLHVSDKLTLTAFSGALYNSFLLWSSSNYSEEKELLIQNMVSIFETYNKKTQ